ncbi:MAG: RES family NAD+ phosphorylase [Aeromonadaceae bacterium]|nr:RES family NAD+ phosphorylase [Aeromonadaceae bacterium]
MRLYRLVKTRFAKDAFTGEGALKYGGRWNSKGHLGVYLGETVALCQLETLVHLNDADELKSFTLFTLDVPDEQIQVLESGSLPDNWNDEVAPAILQEIGDNWLQQAQTLVLLIPSVLSPIEHNALFNPAHPLAATVLANGLQGQPFQMDARLFKM